MMCTRPASPGHQPVLEEGFDPEGSLKLDEIWGSSSQVRGARGKKWNEVMAKDSDATSPNSSAASINTSATRCNVQGGDKGQKTAKRRSVVRREQRKANARQHHHSTETLTTAASTTADGSDCLSGVRVAKLNSSTPPCLNPQMSFVTAGNMTSLTVSSICSTSQHFESSKNTSLKGFTPSVGDKQLDQGGAAEGLYGQVLTQPVPNTMLNIDVREILHGNDQDLRRSEGGETSSPNEVRNRSVVIDPDSALDSCRDRLETGQIPNIPLLQQISVEDRLWSSYSAIYDSDDEDFLPHPFANGYEHANLTSFKALERLHASLIDFSTSLDNSFPLPPPFLEDRVEDSCSSTSSSSSFFQGVSDVEQQEDDVEPPAVESAILDKLDKKIFYPLSPTSKKTKALKRPLLEFPSNGLGKATIHTSAVHRMKNRIRSRRRRQIAILRTVIGHRNSRRGSAFSQEDERRNAVDGRPQRLNAEESTVREGNNNDVIDVTERVSISKLVSRVLPDPGFEGEHSGTHLSSKAFLHSDVVETPKPDPTHKQGRAEGDIDNPCQMDEGTFRTSNQRSISCDVNRELDIIGESKAGTEASLVSNLQASLCHGSHQRSSRERKRPSSPRLHCPPIRNLTPSPTRSGRSFNLNKGHRKTSFGRYFPISRSCPSSPTIDINKPKERTHRVQFIGLSKLPNAGPMTADRWLSGDDEKKKQVVEVLDTARDSSIVSGVSSDTLAIPPKRKKSIETSQLNEGIDVDTALKENGPISSIESLDISDFLAHPPKGAQSLEESRSNVHKYSSSFNTPLLSERKGSREGSIIAEDAESSGSSCEDWVVKPLGEADPLLAELLTRLSNNETNQDPKKSKKPLGLLWQSSGEDSNEESSSFQWRNEISASVCTPDSHMRLDSISSDQSSLDLAPYKPPIPTPGAIEEYSTWNKVPVDFGVSSDSGSASTLSNSTPRISRKKNAQGRSLDCQLSMPSERSNTTILNKVDSVDSLNSSSDKRKQAADWKSKRSKAVYAASRSSSDSMGLNGLPPSGRKAQEILASSDLVRGRGRHSELVKDSSTFEHLASRSRSKSNSPGRNGGKGNSLKTKVGRSFIPLKIPKSGQPKVSRVDKRKDMQRTRENARSRSASIDSESAESQSQQMRGKSKSPSRQPRATAQAMSRANFSEIDGVGSRRGKRDGGRTKKRSSSVAATAFHLEDIKRSAEFRTPPPTQKDNPAPDMLREIVENLPLE